MIDELDDLKQSFLEVKETIKRTKSKTEDPEILKILEEIEEKANNVKI